MSIAYYALNNVAEVENADALSIPRARELVDAVKHQRDYSLVRLLRHPAEGIPSTECLIIDVECDGIPPRNPIGIQYRERFALCVPSDRRRLIDVLALRQDFPILMHQNQGVPGAPASLCLYFEPAPEVTRTWTPQAFLRRIQWWLEKSASGELHPADQPVEGLFFASNYELILPWNFAELRKNPEQRFVVMRAQDRPDGSFTGFLKPSSEIPARSKPIAHIDLTLPPVVHGFVEQDPITLGQLADILAKRGVDLIPPLKASLQEKVGVDGVTAAGDDKGAVILLHIPICRSADTEPESITCRAFLIPIGSLELGVAIGALLIHQQRYFRDLMNLQPPITWREHPVLPMSVLTQNDGAAARLQSGIPSEGPKGVLIGAGSLGSALLNLWGRGGWGHWTVIDKDHLKPHNLARHIAYAYQIGEAKARIVSGLHTAVMEGASKIVPVVADACDFTLPAVAHALHSATLVVDASTTLEYPRAASMVETLPRHLSVFITPNGNAAVLLAEDAKRTFRLRTLEAQYYRAMIQSAWGEVHLVGHTRTFWSGASCRDISLVMPYSRILGQASTLAEQIQTVAASENALIRIWQRDPVQGGVEVHDVPVVTERRIGLGGFDLFIDDGIELHLRSLRQKGLPSETGGVLLGYYDFNIKAVVLVAVLPAPPDSKASPGSFERGIAGLADAVNDAERRTAGMVGYIGEWHSHPPGNSASPSSYDLAQLIHLALGMADDGLPGIQLIVGEDDLRVVQGAVK
jgi:hypothetical protein